jgi:pSer/pThr/pTyr-binding forkhead associated (FHA) protein
MGLAIEIDEPETKVYEETQPDLKPRPSDSNEKNFLILRILKLETTGWDEYEVFSGTTKIQIGKDPEKCDFVIDDPKISDIQAILVPVGTDWYVLDVGKYNMLNVNGVLKRQGILSKNNSCVITLRDTKFVLNTNFTTGVQRNNLSNNDMILVHNNIATNYSFKQTLLIGSSPYCDIKIPGEEYAAVVSSFKQRVSLIPLTGNSLITVKEIGVVEKKAVNIISNDTIQFSGEELRLIIPKETVRERFNFVSAKSVNRLCLAEVVDNTVTDNVYPLPETGMTVVLGRDPNSSIIVIDSPKISRRHAEVTTHDNGITVNDMGSHNGTYINGQKVIKTTTNAGGFVQFGDRKFLVCFAD